MDVDFGVIYFLLAQLYDQLSNCKSVLEWRYLLIK